jgi:hypothetical protein
MSKRKYIAPGAKNLPENFVALEGTSWEKALKVFERELKKSPKNTANFKDSSFKPSPELEKLMDKLLQKDALEIDTVGMSNEKQMDHALTTIFNEVSFEGALNDQEKAVLKQFTAHLRDIIKPLLDTWPGKTNVSLQLRSEVTGPGLVPHIDPGSMSERYTWPKLPFYGINYYVLGSFNSVSTAYFDNKDIQSVKNEEYNKQGINKYDVNGVTLKDKFKEGDEWYGRPWSLTLMTPSLWKHQPCVHSTPRSEDPKKPEKRCLAFIGVSKKKSGLFW